MHEFICLDCQHIFDEEDISTWQENYGEYWGVPCTKETKGCPCCGGAFTEAHKCDCCDNWIIGSYVKLKSGERICENCYISYEVGEE